MFGRKSENQKNQTKPRPILHKHGYTMMISELDITISRSIIHLRALKYQCAGTIYTLQLQNHASGWDIFGRKLGICRTIFPHASIARVDRTLKGDGYEKIEKGEMFNDLLISKAS